MPGMAVHFQLAARVLDAWPDPNEFDPSDTQVRNAFLNGSIGPDMGFYPGGFALPTDLAHYLSTGALARSLVNEARTELERAYAWGWVTHILADVEPHPLVNQGAGELLTVIGKTRGPTLRTQRRIRESKSALMPSSRALEQAAGPFHSVRSSTTSRSNTSNGYSKKRMG